MQLRPFYTLVLSTGIFAASNIAAACSMVSQPFEALFKNPDNQTIVLGQFVKGQKTENAYFRVEKTLHGKDIPNKTFSLTWDWPDAQCQLSAQAIGFESLSYKAGQRVVLAIKKQTDDSSLHLPLAGANDMAALVNSRKQVLVSQAYRTNLKTGKRVNISPRRTPVSLDKFNQWLDNNTDKALF